jgi:hypothetical protein
MNYGLLNKPKARGATMRVWEIADELTASTGELARRKDVIDAYVAEGGNPNTASTQYHYWKTARDDQTGSQGTSPARSAAPRRLRVEVDGRVALPPDVMAALNLDGDRAVSVWVEDAELHMVAPREALKKIHGLLAPLKREGESIVDEFLAERRAMWGDE